MKKMKIIVAPKCANTPEQRFIQELTILFASYEVQKLKQYFTEDIEWKLIGDEPIVGKNSITKALHEMSGIKTVQLTINSIIAQGQEASTYGEMVMDNGDMYGFADFYTFSSPTGQKIKSITSYVIKTNQEL